MWRCLPGICLGIHRNNESLYGQFLIERFLNLRSIVYPKDPFNRYNKYTVVRLIVNSIGLDFSQEKRIAFKLNKC